MKGSIRFFHGAMGGLIIALAGLFGSLMQGTDLNLTRAGIMAAILIPICGYLAFIQEADKSAWQLFQLSLAVPSLLTGVVADARGASEKKALEQQLAAANKIVQGSPPAPSPGASPGGMALLWTPSIVHAADNKAKVYERAPISWHQQIMQAVIGPGDVRNYFVVAGAYRTMEEATLASGEIAKKGLQAQVFNPPHKGDPYTVVVGQHLTYDEANELASRAVKAGLPEWTFAWTFGLPMKPPVAHRFTLFQRRYARIPDAIDKGLWAYLGDVSAGQKEFRLYLCSAPPGAWTVQKAEIREPEFKKQVAKIAHSMAAFPNKPGDQKLELAGRVYLLKAVQVYFPVDGNEKVDFDLLRLL